jgi:hypothetical protein
MKITERRSAQHTVIELTVVEFLLIALAAAWGIGTVIQQIGL